MAQLQVAKNLLFEANDRIFNLECALAERKNEIDELKDEIVRLRDWPSHRTNSKRPHRALGDEPEHPAVENSDASNDEHYPGGRTPSSKRLRFSNSINATLHDQPADAQQPETQIGATSFTVRLDPSASPLGGLPTEPWPVTRPTSPQYSSTSTFAQESSDSPSHNAPHSATPFQDPPISPKYGTPTPERNTMSPLYVPTSPTYALPTPDYYSPGTPPDNALSLSHTPISPKYGVATPQYSPTPSSPRYPSHCPTSPEWDANGREVIYPPASPFDPDSL